VSEKFVVQSSIVSVSYLTKMLPWSKLYIKRPYCSYHRSCKIPIDSSDHFVMSGLYKGRFTTVQSIFISESDMRMKVSENGFKIFILYFITHLLSRCDKVWLMTKYQV